MRGFLVGSVVLVVLYVAVNEKGRGPASATAASNALVAGLRRLLSAGVAGVPDLASKQLKNAGTGVGSAVAQAAAAGGRVVGTGR